MKNILYTQLVKELRKNNVKVFMFLSKKQTQSVSIKYTNILNKIVNQRIC